MLDCENENENVPVIYNLVLYPNSKYTLIILIIIVIIIIIFIQSIKYILKVTKVMKKLKLN